MRAMGVEIGLKVKLFLRFVAFSRNRIAPFWRLWYNVRNSEPSDRKAGIADDTCPRESLLSKWIVLSAQMPAKQAFGERRSNEQA